ncbi:hypothetical protein ABBQ38_012347 [Trebouxia sp. C0009 RCD-2024]
MLSRMGSTLRIALATTVGGGRPQVCLLTSLKDFVPGTARRSWASRSLPPERRQTLQQQFTQRAYSSHPAWDEELEEGEHVVEYVPEQSQQDTPPIPTDEQQLLQVGVVGAPNAGKSTLTNALVGSKVSAVSPKTNTTNVPMLGAWTEGAKQVVLFDTPGVVSPKQYRNAAQATRVSSAWGTASDCDMLLFIVDVHRQAVQQDPRVTQLVKDLNKSIQAAAEDSGDSIPAVLVLNKVDLVKREGASAQQQMIRVAEQLNGLHSFEQTFWVSALRAQGMAKLKDFLLERTTPGEWLMEANQKTDRPPEQIVREVVREKLYRNLHQEVPYNARIVPLSFKQLADGSWRFEQNIVVATNHVKAMVVGKQGAVIGQIGKLARLELDAIFQKTTHLILHVKVERKHGST